MTRTSGTSRSVWSAVQSAADRQLVVLIENGGIDLGLPALVEKLVQAIPGAEAIITPDVRRSLAETINEAIRRTVDTMLESADLALNNFGAARPGLYADVTILRDSTATPAELRATLFDATRAGRVIDLLILTHGGNGEFVSATGSVDAAWIRALRADYGGALNVRGVYMMNCVGSSLNPAWLDAGARTSSGAHRNNYLPEPTLHFFWKRWKAGESFEAASTGAYRDTIDVINAVVRGFVSRLPIPGASLLAGRIDAASWEFVVDSRPEIAGAGSVTIATDALPPPRSAQQSVLVTTVVPSVRRGAGGVVVPFSRRVEVSPAGRTFIENWERPYLAPGTAGEAELARRIAAAEDFLAVKSGAPLAVHQIDALVSFACGIGAQAFQRSSVLAQLERGEVAGIPAEMRRWTRVRTPDGVRESAVLAERRRAEAELFAGAVALAVPASKEVRVYAYQQNPLLLLTGAEAAQIGLGAAAIVQTQVLAKASGSLTVSYDTQQRLLTPEARKQMPGAKATGQAHEYRQGIVRIPQVRPGTAYAVLTIRWEGNAYGEISTPVIEVDQSRSSGWESSEASVHFRAITRLPPDGDPRTWPLHYHYDGHFDPLGNGEWEFSGDVAIDAFGGIRFSNLHSTSRSLIGGNWGDDVFSFPDVVVPVPAIPEDQLAYLRAHPSW
ncbi:MAG: hypothetical protein QM708_14135 [Propioniciclava sp.]|uniref:lysozyme n=1 Tax=Propioniciclava sp. TaxID=2038686 RepID=UPI0039E647C1